MKWTVYSEEKPQMVGSYLVTHTTDSGRYYVDYDYWTVSDKFKYHPTDVVAWMPFPKPYSKDEPQTDEPYEYEIKALHKDYVEPYVKIEDEPQTENLFTDKYGDVWEWRGDAWYCISGDEPQTDCSWK